MDPLPDAPGAGFRHTSPTGMHGLLIARRAGTYAWMFARCPQGLLHELADDVEFFVQGSTSVSLCYGSPFGKSSTVDLSVNVAGLLFDA